MPSHEATCPVNESRSELKHVADLQELIELELPNLRQDVAILAETLPLDVTPEETLRGQVSAEATWVLEFLLQRAGYETERWEKQLPEQIRVESFRYPILRLNNDRIPPGAEKRHTILTVKDTTDNSWITIDPAYQQYLQVFLVKRETLPQNDVMVLQSRDIRIRAEEVAHLRNIHLAGRWYEPDRDLMKKNWPFPFAVPFDEVADFFESLWSPVTYQLSQKRKFSDYVSLAGENPGSVPDNVIKVINELALLDTPAA